MNIIIIGYITDIFPSEIIGSSFEKRVFWLMEPGSDKYKNHYQLECHQGDCNLLDKFRAGELVECQTDLRGKKFTKNGRDFIFNTLKVWKITRVAEQPHPEVVPDASFEDRAVTTPDAIDDLPF